jgi:tRNA(fMet)-specific endonuclease VapC
MVILLDTNAYTALLANDTKVANAIKNSSKVILPVIVVAELFSGFKVGIREDYNMQNFEKFLQISNVEIVGIDYSTAIEYANIYKQLKTDGKPIPVNDIWIAAISIQHSAEILTYDKHFGFVKRLKLFAI